MAFTAETKLESQELKGLPVTDAVMVAAAQALGECSPACQTLSACLLPPLEGPRPIAKYTAAAVAVAAGRLGTGDA